LEAMLEPHPHGACTLRRCWSCLAPLGPRARRCVQCGAAQPRDP
jgi:hypothetical protein